MTAAYDPGAQAVVLGDQPSPTAPDHRITDPNIQQAGVYQPPGRTYGIDDRFGGAAAPVATLGQPVLVQPAQGYTQPYAGQAYGACGPVDPYACQPVYTQPLATPAPVIGTSALRPAHAEIEGRMGDPAETLQSNLMVPFWQQQNIHWFLEIRGQYQDDRSGEGNFGIARRELLSNGLIVGVYGFYDLRHSTFNNNFQQGMLGFELLTLDWEYRVNGYLPFTGTQATGMNSSSVQNGNIVVQQGLERAYFGWDAEFGWLLARLGGTYDHELRGFVGGYYFDTNRAGFPSIGGVRARLEGRLYDLPLLGAGSRFTYGAIYQWDDLRDSQWIASVNLRIPFGSGARSNTRLSPIDRRMLSAIRRDEAIVTGQARGAAEQAIISSNGIVATNVTEASSEADITGGNAIVILANDITTATTIAVNPGQFVGGQFEVKGQNSGATAVFGQKRTITGTNAANNVVQIANNSTLTGLNVTGGKNGIYGGGDDDNDFADGDPGVSGLTISNITVNAPGIDGIRLDGVVHGATITDSTFTGATDDGLQINSFASGTISGNTANNNAYGFYFRDTMTGGSVSGNTANSNQNEGFYFDGVLAGGTISGNTANDNKRTGFEFDAISGGMITGNTASNNVNDGYQFFGAISGGTISGNTATGNNTGGAGFGGFNFFNNADGAPAPNVTISGTAMITGNTATGDSRDGFAFGNVTGGTISGNTATGNNTALGAVGGNGGFSFFDVTGGTIDGNQSTGDLAFDGFFFNTVSGAGVSINNNTATGNSNDGFNFSGNFSAGNLTNNTATNNTANGFTLPGVFTPTSTAGNTASDNGGSNVAP